MNDEERERLEALEEKVEQISRKQDRMHESLVQTQRIARATLELLQSLNLDPKSNDNHNN